MVLSLLALVSAAAAPAAPVKIDATRISEITRTLASPPFEGRAPGTPGEAKTVAYLSERFKAAGMVPGGENGGWTQRVPMLRTNLATDRTVQLMTASGARDLVPNRDIQITTRRDADMATVTNAPLVFVGYGITAPERGWDDFGGADLKGKVAVFLINDPDFEAKAGEAVAGRFGGKAMTYYGRWTYKFEEAERRGAVAALIVHDAPGAGYGWETVTARGGENYDIRRPDSGASHPALEGWLSGEAAADLFARAGLDLAAQRVAARDPKFKAVPLEGASLSAAIPIKRERFDSHNVVGKIVGTAHPEEAILFGGHWDAYGVKPKAGGGSEIRPGAVDDAIGVAAVIELARAFAAGPKPQRSLVFAAWTAEESGLLGSEYYAQHPLVPLEKTVANVTLDVLQTGGPSRNVVLVSSGQSDMDDLVAAAAKKQGRTVTTDQTPEKGYFFRADHFSVAKRGVPSELFMGTAGGVDFVNGGTAAGAAWVAGYMKCYHQACDTWSADWNLGGAVQDVEVAYEVGKALANSRRWPKWRPTSEFAKLRP